VCRSFCVLLTITPKSNSINSFSLSMIGMLLFAENRFIASAFFQNLIYAFGDSPMPSHLKSHFCQVAVADPIKNGGLYSTSIFLQTILLLSILQWFNLIIYSLNTYRLNDYYYTMCSNWDTDENVIFNDFQKILLSSISQSLYMISKCDCLNMRIQEKIKA